MTLKDWWRNYKNIGVFCMIFLVFLVVLIVGNRFGNIEKQEETNEERVDLSEFSNVLQMDKEGEILSYPEITLLAEMDGEIINLNVEPGDIVQEWDILMEIGDADGVNKDVDVESQIWIDYEKYYDKVDEYNQFQTEHGKEIEQLERQLFENNSELNQAIDADDSETKNIKQMEIGDISRQLKNLKSQRETIKIEMNNLQGKIQKENEKSIQYYSDLDKEFPKSTIYGIVGDIYVKQGDEVKNGDKLVTIINNENSPEISVSLNFNEYVLTKNLTGVTIVTENENWGNSYYDGEIYTRSPVLNGEGEYTIIVKILEEVSDLILNDENTKITVYFTIDSGSSEYIRIPRNCFSSLGKTSGKLTLRDGNLVQEKEVGIKSRWNEWNNVENFIFFSLENEEEKDGIKLCIDDWNRGVIEKNDVNIINWYNQFDSVDKFCEEFVKVNPMYGENRNLAIVPDLGGNGNMVEVLCKI